MSDGLSLRVFFRVLAGHTVGLGHIMRCKSLALEMARKGWQILWVLNSANRGLLQDLALPGELSEIAPDSWSDEWGEWQALESSNLFPALIVIDGYAFTSAYLKQLARLNAKMLLFDDSVIEGELPVDWILNSSPGATQQMYAGRSAGQLLLGPFYAPVNLSFCSQPKKPIRTRGRILVMFGGSDPDNLTCQFLKALKSGAASIKYPIDLVTGAAFLHKESVESILAKSEPKLPITYYHNHNDVPALMSDARIALSAGGSTVFELAVMQVPSVLLVVADNQLNTAEFVQAFEAYRVIDARRKRIDMADVIGMCTSLVQSIETHEASIQNSLSWCDGRGVIRIAEILTESFRHAGSN